MVTFKINLLRNQVAPQPIRRKIFRAMALYLTVSGCLLILLGFRAARKLQSAFQDRQKIARMEERFREQHPGFTDIVPYGRELNQKLDKMSEAIQTCNAACENRVELARILLALSAPLPATVNISAVELSQTRKTFEFEVDFPVEGASETIDATRLLQVWNSDPTLSSQIGRISSVRSQKRNMQGRFVENWRFAGSRLLGGK